jgi:hypothetical protein
MISLEFSHSYFNNMGFFKTNLLLLNGDVLMNIIFLEIECKDSDKTMCTPFRVDIYCMLRSAFPSLQIVSIMLSLIKRTKLST